MSHKVSVKGFLSSLVSIALFLFVTPTLFSSCSTMQMDFEEPERNKIAELNSGIAELAIEISSRVREFSVSNKTIAVTTFVELDNLEKTSSFGRYVSEQLSAELFKLGFSVRELRQRVDIDIIRTKGELILSRRSEKLMKKFQVDSVIAGSYTVVGQKVTLNVRLLSLDTSRLISVGRIVADLKHNNYIAKLLSRGAHEPSPVVKVFAVENGGM
ncbi:hypothetical protein MNBD_NITROSPINAE04-561 [hydrothermal vent metagenome]|uniref:FlgO domain-containing protein n=1 Tax=hydrothermal vent metagenome TaxID=652676 RepID=A0A3B1BJV9_9ZZZZ